MNKTILTASAFSYQKIAKPIAFSFSPEFTHDSFLSMAKLGGKLAPVKWSLKKAWAYEHRSLNQKIDGISYNNPVGLAAGWDKDATALQIMPALGFGFIEVGSITKDAYEGNEGTRLWRLPKSKSIVVNYGLKNSGVDVIAPRVAINKLEVPIGTNIARTNSPDCSDDLVSIADYVYSFKKLAKIGSYFTINISCPNTFGGQPFHEPTRLKMLLTELDKIPTKKPIYLKLSPDISTKHRQEISKLSFRHRVDGFICGNLTKNRQLADFSEADIPELGGLSGKPVSKLSDQLISDMYELTKGKKTIIGLGGIFSAHDAYQKIQLGASLVQLITGLIYEGPQIVGQINHDLVDLLKKDGLRNISEAVGTANKI